MYPWVFSHNTCDLLLSKAAGQDDVWFKLRSKAPAAFFMGFN